MTTIYKYPLAEFEQNIQMPQGATILAAQMQDGRITLWAACDPCNESEARKFRVIGTGGDLPDGFEYVGTVQSGPYVWHVFEDFTSAPIPETPQGASGNVEQRSV